MKEADKTHIAIAYIVSFVAIILALFAFANSQNALNKCTEMQILSGDSLSAEEKEDHYDEPIPMLHMDDMLVFIKGIDGLTDETIEKISAAWEDSWNTLQIMINPSHEDGSMIHTYLDLRDGTCLSVTFTCGMFDHKWEILSWDRYDKT